MKAAAAKAVTDLPKHEVCSQFLPFANTQGKHKTPTSVCLRAGKVTGCPGPVAAKGCQPLRDALNQSQDPGEKNTGTPA